MTLFWAATSVGEPDKVKERGLELFWLFLGVAVLFLLGACCVALFNRWRKRAAEETSNGNDQLAHFRLLYEQGELSRQEFDRIRALLGQKLRKEMNLPSPIAEVEKEPEVKSLPLNNGAKASDNGSPGEHPTR